jgi:EAL domain-containing protein (putative c-di-GMP-specific phosphodiesterase class I)
LLGPDVFMSVAEETGIIKELSHHVLNEASRQLGIWQRAFRPERPLFVSVNVSSSQLFNTDLVDEVRALLGREDISPGSLKLELTESLVMENPELSVEILERLKALGVGLACDDFGTGYSALASLRRLPFDILKVDRSFLEADPEDEKAIIILETVILLAHDLHMTVVAEGIESQEQITTLAELECDLGQGFLIGEPMSAKQVVEALGGGSFIATKPVFSGIWDKLSGRKPSEVAAPVPATIPAPAAAEPVAEEAILPALATVKAALDGATQALALQKLEPRIEEKSEPAEMAQPAEPPPELPAAEKPPVHVSFKDTFTLPQPEALPPPPPTPPPPPAESAGLSAAPLPSTGPKPGSAPFISRATRPVITPIPITPRISLKSAPKDQNQLEPRKEPVKSNGALPAAPEGKSFPAIEAKLPSETAPQSANEDREEQRQREPPVASAAEAPHAVNEEAPPPQSQPGAQLESRSDLEPPPASAPDAGPALLLPPPSPLAPEPPAELAEAAEALASPKLDQPVRKPGRRRSKSAK